MAKPPEAEAWDISLQILLQALTSKDNVSRNQAEVAFNGLKSSQPERLVDGLLEVVQSTVLPPHVRELSTVLLRRVLILEEPVLWDRLPEDGECGRRALGATLLRLLTQEGDACVRRKVGDMVGELGCAVLDEDGQAGWPELLPFLLQASGGLTPSVPHHSGIKHAGLQPCSNQGLQGQAGMETGLQLMSATAEHVARFASSNDAAMEAIMSTLQRCLSGGVGEVDVRLDAVRALAAVVVSFDQPSDQVGLAPCLPHLLDAVQATLYTGCDNKSCECLELMIELAELCPSYLRPLVGPCVMGMAQVASNASLPNSVRHLGLEFLVSLVESAPAMCRKIGTPGGTDHQLWEAERAGRHGQHGLGVEKVVGSGLVFARTVLPICFDMMMEVEDDPTWMLMDVEEEDPLMAVGSEVGAEALERVAQTLGHRSSLPVCFDLVANVLGQGRWKEQHAALSALGSLAHLLSQVSGEEGERLREQALTSIIPFLEHTHPRVRHAALEALAHTAVEQGASETLSSPSDPQENRMGTILSGLLSSLNKGGDTPTRVVAHACVALVNVLDACPQGVLHPYINTILERCIILLQVGPLMVQERTISVVSSMAEAAQYDFGPFYAVIMPLLKQILSRCNSLEQRLLRGKTLECVSLVGATVGKERFGVDALAVMDAMVQAQAGGLEDDDPTKVYMLRAWVRICKCLGEDFAPYLPLVIPPLLTSAAAKVEVDVPPDDSDEKVDNDEVGSDVDCMEDLDGNVVAVRTCLLEEQATACQMLLLLADALQEHFLPYVEAVADQLAALVNTSPHDDVRTFCMAGLPELVRSCGKAAAMQGSDLELSGVRQLLEFFLGRLMESLEQETCVELLMTAVQAVKRCVQYACVRWENHTKGMGDPEPTLPESCRPVLNKAQMDLLVTNGLHCLGQSFRRRAIRRAEATASEDWDEVEDQRAAEAEKEETELHVNLAELFGCLLQTHGDGFLPTYVELLLPHFLEMAQPDSVPSDRKVAVHMLDQVLEFAPKGAQVLMSKIVPVLHGACRDSDPGIRMAAFFGLGLSAKFGPAFSPFSFESLRVLEGYLREPGVHDGLYQAATDNAVSALGLLLEFQRDSLTQNGVQVKDAWGQWLSHLPLQGDEEESQKVTDQLCRLLENSVTQTDLLGVGLDRLPAALTALAQVVGTDLAGPKAHVFVARSVLAMQGSGGSSNLPLQALAQAMSSLGEEEQRRLNNVASSYSFDAPSAFCP